MYLLVQNNMLRRTDKSVVKAPVCQYEKIFLLQC
jgi:hypothetical protein